MITVLMQIWCYSADFYKTFNAALPQGAKNEIEQYEKILGNFLGLLRLSFDNTSIASSYVSQSLHPSICY
jgi:hypothetical protein